MDPKCKISAMDSAIADMSNEDSFSTVAGTPSDDTTSLTQESTPVEQQEPALVAQQLLAAVLRQEDEASTRADNLSDNPTTVTQIQDAATSQPAKRRRSSFLAPPGFDFGDFGTAASQRTRRAAARKTIPPPGPQESQEPPQKRRRTGSKKATINESHDLPTEETSAAPVNEVSPPLDAHEVKASPPEREKTPQRDQAAAALPTPPQTLNKADTQTIAQSLLRRSARERLPTKRYQESSNEEVTPCKKRTRTSVVSAGSRNESLSATRNRKSRVVRLRVGSNQESSQSMSLTESFSHRQKRGDSKGSQIYQSQNQSVAGIGSFQDHSPEVCAQPQSSPILADSQELYSSHSTHNDDATSHTTAHLQEHLQTEKNLAGQHSSTLMRQRQRSALTPEASPRQADASTSQKNAGKNISWQTQPTQPWFPSCNGAPSATFPATVPTQSIHASQATTIDEAPIQLLPSTQTLTKQGLHDIADQLLAHRTYGPPKPEPAGQPSVWADARMDLCETLHYFRSYQGACHSTGGFVRGFMFDKVAHPRDYTDSNVVIARAGGGQVRDKNSGEMKATGDQVEGIVSQNLRNCMNHYNPVVIITGTDNPHMPSQPPHQYCVLDHFKPTHIWTEKSGKSKIVRYRFEKLNAKKDSWWQAKDTEDPVELGSLPPPVSKACGTCARESLQIYLNGWMCLQPTCGSFWLILPSGSDYRRGSTPFEPDEASLTYDPRFLKAHTPWPNDDHTYPLTSTDAATSAHAVPGEDTSEAFTRGVVCPRCGRCTSRLSWTGWECTCGWTKSPPHTLIPALSTREPLWPLSNAYTPSRDTHSPLVTVSVSFAHGYRINRYALPGIDGFVTHMIANARVAAEPHGPDAMFEALQAQDIGLRRRAMDGAMLKGGIYTRHFCVNYGMPYKFIAATESHPFPPHPHPVSTARARLDWAARFLLAREPPPEDAAASPPSSPPSSTPPGPPSPLASYTAHSFNEVLALGYFETQRISYHDDGESALGPTIATLSLGAPGTMRIRLKSKHHLGVSSAGVYTDAPPLPGCVAHAARAALGPELAALRAGPGKQYRARLKQIPTELGLKAGGSARNALVLRVAHGDVVLMQGEEVQRFYEHAVEHQGKLRFALTCRYIDGGEGGESGCEIGGVRDGEGEGGYDGAMLGEEELVQGHEGCMKWVDDRYLGYTLLQHSAIPAPPSLYPHPQPCSSKAFSTASRLMLFLLRHLQLLRPHAIAHTNASILSSVNLSNAA
ncbi:hypothetical protein C7974DRAFT_419759 [Boeremia exigua]|uniref:uncharacterized protein n=1 Tax=Boeremia exigua TaxID=749465 RepID=UPI001E8D0F69|nr:uncharacterized protein C7974DRAFT_419759 [Boeremia exigua]KAH6644241.1 hypothetical protein C7974DRAFT_419759 [Boeremia exigua]